MAAAGTAVSGRRFLILADDLTGAGDTAIALSGQDGVADLYLDDMPAGVDMAAVTAIDLHTRDLAVDDACRRVASAASRVPAGVEIYKKIDSTLRGHIGAELGALCAHLPDGDTGPVVCIVAPAFPDMGRTLEEGELRIHGKPVDAAALWGAGAPRSTGGIAAELRAHGFACLSLHLGDIRAGQDADLAERMARIMKAGGPAHPDAGAVRSPARDAGAVRLPALDETAIAGRSGTEFAAIVCDAASMDDMRRIVRAARTLPARCVWVGSAGLAHAMADVRIRDAAGDNAHGTALPAGSGATSPYAATPVQRPLVFVVGSFSTVAAEQVRGLVDNGHAVHVPMPVDDLISGIGAQTARRIEEHLLAGRDLVLSIPRDEIRPDLAARLAAGMAHVAQGILPRVGALVCCGGDTSRALLDRMGARRLRVRRCGEPGATLAWCDVHPDMPLVMKAGAFGDAGALINLHHELKITRGTTVESTATSPVAATARPIVAITMGDAAGIGPEIIARALASPEVYRTCRPVVIGDANRLEQAVRIVGKKLDVRRVAVPADGHYVAGAIDCVDLALIPPDTPFGVLSAVCGDAAYRFIERAVQLAVARDVDAICTAPLNKEALHAGGHIYPGHTELLAELTGTPEVSMMLSSPQLKVIHVTTHIGLLDAIERIEPQLVGRVIQRIHDTLHLSGIDAPHIGVCGINPHAGENGLFGRGEEGTKIVPAIEAARARGIDVEGPLPADTLFFRAARGDFDGVVAMYHDQGHGPVKVMGLEAGVNVTIGLPVIRTSVDHGTAFDIAGKGIADEGSLIEALRQAIALAPRGRA